MSLSRHIKVAEFAFFEYLIWFCIGNYALNVNTILILCVVLIVFCSHEGESRGEIVMHG